MQLIPPEKIYSSRVSVRKARESHLIDKARGGGGELVFRPSHKRPINVRFRVAKVRFCQILEYSVPITLAKETKEGKW